MNYVTILGLLAGVLTTSSFLPQIYQTHRTKKTRDLSLFMFIALTGGIFLWVIYGILLKSLPIILANAIAFIMCIYLVIMKIKHG